MAVLFALLKRQFWLWIWIFSFDHTSSTFEISAGQGIPCLRECLEQGFVEKNRKVIFLHLSLFFPPFTFSSKSFLLYLNLTWQIIFSHTSFKHTLTKIIEPICSTFVPRKLHVIHQHLVSKKHGDHCLSSRTLAEAWRKSLTALKRLILKLQ